MDVNPTTSTKRGRSKAKAAPPARPVVVTKKPRAKKAMPDAIAPATAASTPEPRFEPGAIDLGDRIATTAYYIAAGRNFAAGHELEDWLEAERRVKAVVAS